MDVNALWKLASSNVGIKFAKRGTPDYDQVYLEFVKLRVLETKKLEQAEHSKKIQDAKNRKNMCKMEKENLRIESRRKR